MQAGKVALLPHKRGLTYNLGKNALEVSYKVRLFDVAQDSSFLSLMGISISKPNGVILVLPVQDSLVLKTSVVTDRNLGFFVPASKLAGLAVDTNLAKLDFNDDGTLKSATYNAEDRTADIVEDVVETAENVAKTIAILMAMGGTSPRSGLWEEIGQVELSQPVDLAQLGSGHLILMNGPCQQIKDEASKTRRNPLFVPFWVAVSATPHKKLAGSVSSNNLKLRGKDYVDGVVLRTAAPVRFNLTCQIARLTRSPYTFASETTPVLQAGDFSYVPMKSSLLTNRLQKLNVTHTAGQSTYEITSSSAAEKLALTFANIAKNLADFSRALPTLGFEIRQKQAEHRTTLVNSQTALKDAQKLRLEKQLNQ
ncbi:MAG: hypothetical protein KC777_27790 [Cyanobacteria bacterium HKST-UBA02]|nr:hypothetical protein [Cyanobacteria bacterium HKST-UBA02]